MPNNRSIPLLFSCLAALHVFVFSAAFPFFSVVDEQVHLDLVVHYSEADIPRTLTPPTVNALPYIVIYGTPEYLFAPASFPDAVIPPPPWKQPMQTVRDKLAVKMNDYRAVFKNHEASQPPLYYALAGAWWHGGKMLGFDGGQLLYWLRFMNVLVVVAAVWLGWLAARRLFPENAFVQCAVPAFIALMPQTSFYSINNDAMAPLTFGLLFLAFMKFYSAEVPAVKQGLAVGLAFAAAYLTKTSNLPLLAVTVLFLVFRIFKLLRQNKFSSASAPVAILVVTAGVPVAAWMVWCKKNFGDLTGSSVKIQFLNWGDKPFAEWFHHPIFSLHGFWYFLSRNLSTFWQGEFLWQGQPLAIADLDRFYVGFTLFVLLVTVVVVYLRGATLAAPQRTAIWFGLMCFAAMLAFFALLSVKYDFRDCFYPSTALPYFVSGRLMLGLLVPFFLMVALALDRLLGKSPPALKFTVLGLLLAFMLVSEITVDWKIFPNPYNWYHM